MPMALASFPSRFAGLDAYRKLREFRRLHETNYPLEIMRDPDNPKALLPKKKRARVLMDQHANSVADLAAVLCQLEDGPSVERTERFERVSKRVRWLVKVKKLKPVEGGEEKEEARKAGVRRRLRLEKVDVGSEMRGCEGVEVQWMDLRDAEMAEKWPKAVVHSPLGRSRYTAAWPRKDVGKEESEREEGGKEGEKKEGGGKEKEVSDEAIREGLATRKPTWKEVFFGPKFGAKQAARK